MMYVTSSTGVTTWETGTRDGGQEVGTGLRTQWAPRTTRARFIWPTPTVSAALENVSAA